MNQRKAIPNRFSGKVAIVTGGSAGIGRATVEELCREGASVVFSGIEPGPGAETERELMRAGCHAHFLLGDMAEEPFTTRIVEETVDRFKRIDYLVNNAFSFAGKGQDATSQEWHRVFDVGPIAYARMASLVVPEMKKIGQGAIVNLSSISAFIAQANRWTYNTAKGAVHLDQMHGSGSGALSNTCE